MYVRTVSILISCRLPAGRWKNNNSKNIDDAVDGLFADGFTTSYYRDNDGDNDFEFSDQQQERANGDKSSPSSHNDIADTITNEWFVLLQRQRSRTIASEWNFGNEHW